MKTNCDYEEFTDKELEEEIEEEETEDDEWTDLDWDLTFGEMEYEKARDDKA